MNMELMKRRLAALLCAALLTSGMPAGALAEGEAEAIQAETAGAQESGGEETYKKFKLKPETVEGVLCVSVSGASVLDVQVRVLNAKGETVAKQTVVKGTGTAFFADLMPGVYTLSAAYADKDAAAAVKAVSLEYEIIDEEAVRKAAEEEALKKAAADAMTECKALVADEEAKWLQDYKDKGCEVVENVDIESFRAASAEFWQEMFETTWTNMSYDEAMALIESCSK